MAISNFEFVLPDAKPGRKQPSSSDYLATQLPSDLSVVAEVRSLDFYKPPVCS